jgi:NAD-dependent oxidoreductase involved in siderophore biosynthesis
MKSPNSLCGVLLCIPLASCASQQPAEPAAPVAHRLIGQDRGQVSIVAPDGTVEWQVPCAHN